MKRLLLLACTLLWPSIASAQRIAYGGDVLATSRYEWRGTTRRNGWVLQPNGYVSLGKDGWWLAGGLWTSIELTRPDSSWEPTTGRRWFGEVDVWLEFSHGGEVARVSAGGAHYGLNPGRDSASAYPLRSSTEVFGRLTINHLGWIAPLFQRLTPEFAIHAQSNELSRSYAEGALTVRVPLWTGVLFPVHSIFLRASAGYNLGQDSTMETKAWYFKETGRTHVEVSAGTTIGALDIGWISAYVRPEVHYLSGRDPIALREDRVDMPSDGKRWTLVLSISVTGPRCQPARAICR